MGLVAMMLPTMVTAQTATTLSDADLPRTFTFEVGSGDSAYVSFANGRACCSRPRPTAR